MKRILIMLNCRDLVAPAIGAVIGFGTLLYDDISRNPLTYASLALTALANQTIGNSTGNITGNFTN